MKAIIGLVFCLLTGIMVRSYGFGALLWVPLGFVVSLFITAQMVLPILLGFPRAGSLVRRGQMRGSVFFRLLLTPLIWFMSLTILGFAWPAGADYLYNNIPLNLGAWLGTLAILFSPLSKASRSDFNADFDRAYAAFYRDGGKAPTAVDTIDAQFEPQSLGIS